MGPPIGYLSERWFSFASFVFWPFVQLAVLYGVLLLRGSLLLKDAREFPERNDDVSLPLRVLRIACCQLFADFQAQFVGVTSNPLTASASLIGPHHPAFFQE
jgi:hypothetical protein